MSVALHEPSPTGGHERPAPVGGRLMTGAFRVVLALAGLGFLLVVWRFAVGLGRVSAMSDGYPWGLWIAFDVVTGTALACGGYAMAILVYIFNKGRYHPLVRPAILTSALGYSIAAISIVVDVGRPWGIHRIPIRFWQWNLNSALLEVALCVMAYVTVLWIELAPAFLERWQVDGPQRLRTLADRTLPIFEKALPWIVALGLVLPTMHQSSLGSVMLLTGEKLHRLWHTPFLPLLFLLGCVGMGYAAVVIESTLATTFFRRRSEVAMLRSLERGAAFVALVFVAWRVIDLLARGRAGLMFAFDVRALLFWVETLLLVVPALVAFTTKRPLDPGRLFGNAVLLGLGGVLYRMDTYLVAYSPGPGWSYFPSIPETLITVGLVATEIAVYIALVKRFPILGGSLRPVHAR